MSKQELIQMSQDIVHKENACGFQLAGLIIISVLWTIGVAMYMSEGSKTRTKIILGVITIGMIIGFTFWGIHLRHSDLDLRHLKAVYDIEKRS